MTRREAAIELKIKKALALMDEVEALIQHKFYTTAISRLYYSCFHATKALLLTQDIVTKTHSGVSTLLHQHFVLPDLFDSKHASFFNKLMKKRIHDDYSDFMISNQEEVEEFIKPAKEYLSYTLSVVKEILAKN
jgi:uncharacterized protein (UPF0332 family)